MTLDPDRPLTDLLEGLADAASGPQVSVSDVLDQMGNRAITPFIMLIALMMVSPLSGIPGVPTLSAFLIVTLALQALFGRQRLWLPDRMMHMEIASHRVLTAISWIRRPSAFLDRHSRPRLTVLTMGVMRWFTLLICVIIPLFWPPLEFLPLMSTFGASMVALLAFGLLTRDGVYVLAGYIIVGLTILMVFVVF